jgi:acetate kinase
MGREELSLSEANTMLNKHSGLAGVSGLSSDMREIIKAMKSDSHKAKLAFEIYCYRIKKYVGAYAAAMGGLEMIVFTAGIGENSPDVRAASVKGLEFLGVKIDPSRNEKAIGVESMVSADSSTVKIAVVPTDEELVIAGDTLEFAVKTSTPEKPVSVK